MINININERNKMVLPVRAKNKNVNNIQMIILPVGTAETVKTKEIKIKNKDFNCIIPKILLIGVL